MSDAVSGRLVDIFLDALDDADYCDAIAATFAAATADDLEALAPAAVADVRARALREAADWLYNGELAEVVAYDGPSNRGEVVDAYHAALEDPEQWLRERAEAEGGDR